MLKDLWIQITWDGDKNSSVSVPFGMFFGTFPDFYQIEPCKLELYLKNFIQIGICHSQMELILK